MKGSASHEFEVVAKGDDNARVGDPGIVQRADRIHRLDGRKGKIGGGAFNRSDAGVGDDQGALVTDRINEDAIRGNFRRRVKPGSLAFDRDPGDEMVEGLRRGDGFVEADAGANENRVGVWAKKIEHGGQKGVLILAVTVLVLQDFAGMMRLIPADAEGYADISDLGSDICIDGADFSLLGTLASRNFRDFGLYLGVDWEDAVAEKCAIPVAYSLPTLEGCPGDRGKFAFLFFELLLRGPWLLLLAVLFRFCLRANGGLQLRGFPAVDVFS